MSSIIVSLAVGLLLLYVGAEGLVRGSASLALRFGLTKLAVGLTIVAFGTSSPELVVSVKAALDGNGAISLGNVIGSDICNIALILGLSALVRPLKVNAQVVRIQIPIMIGATFALALMLLDGRLQRLEGLGLFGGIIVYTWFSIYLARKEASKSLKGELDPTFQIRARKTWLDGLFILTGLAALVVGGGLFISGAVSLAETLGVNQAVIGLTIVAAGTSIPELATSLVASIRKEGDIAVGNVVGSNIFNIFGILGIAALLRPIEMGGIQTADLIVMIVVAILILPMARTGFTLTRWEGTILLAVYSGYIYYLLKAI